MENREISKRNKGGTWARWAACLFIFCSLTTLLALFNTAQAAQITNLRINQNGYDFRSSEIVTINVCFNVTGEFSTSLLSYLLWMKEVNTAKFVRKIELYKATYRGASKSLVEDFKEEIHADRGTSEARVRHCCHTFKVPASKLGKGKSTLRAYVTYFWKSGGELTGHTLKAQSKRISVWVDSKTATGTSQPAKVTSPRKKTPSKPKYKTVKVKKVVKEPYQTTETVIVTKTVQERRPVTKWKTVPKKCTKTKTVIKKVPVVKKVQEKVKVKKTRWVDKKVKKRVKVTKQRTITKKVPEKVTRMVEKVVGKKKVTKKLKSTKWVEVEEPYWDTEYITEQKRVTKIRKVPKTRVITTYETRTVKEPYECKKNVIVGTKPTEPQYETKRVKKYRNEKKPYETVETVYVDKRVKKPRTVSQRVKRYRWEKQKVTKIVYQYRYVWERRGNRNIKVRKRYPRRVTQWVNKKVPYYVTEKRTVYEWVTQKVPVKKKVTKYKMVKVPYYETIKVPVKNKKSTVLYKTVTETCYRTVKKKVPKKMTETYYVDEKYTVTEPRKVSKRVKKYRKVKKPKEVVREVYSYEPIKKKVQVSETIYKTKQVTEPYTDYEEKLITERVKEPYWDYEIKTVEKKVYQEKPFTQTVEYDCSQKVKYTDYETVPVKKKVKETRKVTKYREKVVWETKRVPVS